jgi:hypothetical protein
MEETARRHAHWYPYCYSSGNKSERGHDGPRTSPLTEASGVARIVAHVPGGSAMQVQLYCPQCACCFAAAPETPASEVLDRMADEGPWYALGDGETFEDMIFTTLLANGDIRCTECGEPAAVSEASLGQLTMEVLGSW